MTYLKINNIDFSPLVAGMKVGYEVLVSDKSGRNAAGDTVVDIINRKTKLYISLRHTTEAEMRAFLAAIEDYVVTVKFLDAKTKTLKEISAYIGTPEPDYYTIQDNHIIYKPMNLNFIEL